MTKQKRYTRAELISFLRSQAVRGTGTRYRPYTVWGREAGQHSVLGLEHAGSSSSWRASNVVHVENGVITQEELRAWPRRSSGYRGLSTRASYIGAQKILELLGEPISKSDIREARKARKVAEIESRNRYQAKAVRRAYDALVSELDKCDLVPEDALVVFGNAFGRIDELLPPRPEED